MFLAFKISCVLIKRLSSEKHLSANKYVPTLSLANEAGVIPEGPLADYFWSDYTNIGIFIAIVIAIVIGMICSVPYMRNLLLYHILILF